MNVLAYLDLWRVRALEAPCGPRNAIKLSSEAAFISNSCALTTAFLFGAFDQWIGGRYNLFFEPEVRHQGRGCVWRWLQRSSYHGQYHLWVRL